jgi:hypothetical protein
MSEKKKEARSVSVYTKVTPSIKAALDKIASDNNISLSTLIFMLIRKEFWQMGE